MNNSVIAENVRTCPGEKAPQVPRDQAVSFVAAFDAVKQIVGKYRAPKRPNRNRPANQSAIDMAAAIEIAANTPALDVLRALAAEHRPSTEFFDGDMERPW
jgi:hypothetical protein